jgi:hypothetical protein
MVTGDEAPETDGTGGQEAAASHHVPKLHMSNAMPSTSRLDARDLIETDQELARSRHYGHWP